MQYGQDIVNADPNHNIMFSIHFYGERNQKTFNGINWSDYDKLFWTIKYEKKLTVIAGEFGNQPNVNYKDLLK